MSFRKNNSKIITCFLLTVFVCGQISFASVFSRAALAPPLYLKPPCSIELLDDGAYGIKITDPSRSHVEFIWFLVAEALEKDISEDELKNLISELFKEQDELGVASTIDFNRLQKSEKCVILPLKNGDTAFRFFREEDKGVFSEEFINPEKLLLLSGKVVRFSTFKRQDSLMSGLSKQDADELNAIIDTVNYLWENHRYLWNNLHRLQKILREEYGFQLIKTAGRKLLMFSKKRRFIFKVNLEPDNAYAKEKLFFERGIEIPSTRVFFHHDEAHVLVFDNVTINNGSILFYDYLRDHILLEEPASLERMMGSYARVLVDIHNAPRLPEGDPGRAIFRDQSMGAQL